jgi:putative tricarboxylic transport membrane protein
LQISQQEFIGAFATAIDTILSPWSIVLIFLATLLGMVMGFLPGLGGPTTLALLIPVTFEMDPLVAFMVLTAATGGVNFGGSITAILFNTPGTAPNAATLIDGYPMNRDGRAGEAISAAATSSAIGAFVGVGVLILIIPVVVQFLLLFGTAEIFWLGIWGLSVVAIIVRGNYVSGLVSAGLGILIALHGINSMTTTIRWDYGFTFMQDGFKLVPAIIGLFAIGEMVKLMGEGTKLSKTTTKIAGSKLKGIKSVFKNKALFFRSAVIGVIIGMIPGVGGTAANYIAYFQALKTTKDNENFGKGDVRGVIASESSNDAKDGGSLLPTLGFGIPGSATTAVLLGAFLLHGMVPGPLLMQQNLDVVAMIIVTLVISNVITSVTGILATDFFVKITKIDITVLAPIIILVAFFGSYALQNNIYNIVITLVFGFVGYGFIKMQIPRVPLILAMILTPIIESNYFRGLQISSGSFGIFFESWVSRILITLVLLSLFLPYLKILASRAVREVSL